MFSNGPTTVTNGLVLALDAADKNSYPGSGTSWFDLSGNNNTGTLTNGPTFNTGSGGSIVFDGVDDYVTGSIATLNDFTVNCYIRSTDITSALRFYPIGLNFSGSFYGGGIWFGGSFSPANKTGIYDGINPPNEKFVTSSLNITTNTWTFVAVTRESTTSTVYVNGISSGQGSISSNPILQYTLGRRTDGAWPYKGNIATVQLYNRALSATEILQNYNSTKTRFGL